MSIVFKKINTLTSISIWYWHNFLWVFITIYIACKKKKIYTFDCATKRTLSVAFKTNIQWI